MLLGRSEVIRTPGILLPKQARYQLRYTPIEFFFSALALLERMDSPNSIMDFLPKVNGGRCISRKKDL